MMVAKEEHKEGLLELLKGSAGMTRTSIAKTMAWSPSRAWVTVTACVEDGTVRVSDAKYGRGGHEGTVTYVEPRASYFQGWAGAPELGLALWKQQ